jgi:uncharacterized protein with HEPN domain
MPPKPSKDQKAYLHDMLESAQKALGYVQDVSYDEFWRNSEKRDAVAMRIAAIGEAARQITAATEAAVPNVPFHLIRGMRNRIAHHYDKVDFVEVWKVTQQDLLPLVAALKRYFLEEQQRQESTQPSEPPQAPPSSP